MSQIRPLIGLTGRRKKAGHVIGTPKILADLDGDWFYADYARGVLEAGGLPVHLPLDADPEMFVGRLDGILLSGGADIGPDRYGMAPETEDFPPEPQRDEFELRLLAGAAEEGIPVLGICRGLQMVNVFAGGTLHQHIPEHAKFDLPTATLSHPVEFTEGSTLAGLYGTSLKVNSLHHQTVDRVGDKLKVTASAHDTVEGLEHESLPILAVQWHPEMLPTRKKDPIFSWLVTQAGAV
jgi:putative glutamine amidotransferase